MKIALIVAMDRERGIGRNNDLMWHLPDDMQFFKDTTKGQIVLMGRKNYESIPEKYRPLPGRENIILTRNKHFQAPGCKVVNSIEEALALFDEAEKRTFFIIGGGEVYRLALEKDVVDEMYVTHIDKSYGADTFFPEINDKEWTSEVIMEHEADNRHEAGFSINKYFKR